MQGVHTFILKMLVNQDTPGSIIGSLQSIPDQDMYPFRDSCELISLLEQLTRKSQQKIPSEGLEEACLHNSEVSAGSKRKGSIPKGVTP